MSNTSENSTSVCANCGKGEESNEDLKACSACQLVKYCNRECQLAHRPQHKKECKKRAAELHEEALFKERPREKCPGYSVLGTVEHKLQKNEGGKLCVICKTPAASSNEEDMMRIKEHADMGNAQAVHLLGVEYSREGNMSKAHELWVRAGRLGCSEAYNELANSMNPIHDEYNEGGANKRLGVKMDLKKAKYYYELAAIMGDVQARYFLGLLEGRETNSDVGEYTFEALEAKLRHREPAVKHFELAARAGHEEAMDQLRKIHNRQAMVETFSNEEYADIVRAYTKSRDEMKSDDREKALVIRDMYWGRGENF